MAVSAKSETLEIILDHTGPELKGTVILSRLAHKSGAGLRVAYASHQKSGFDLLRGARWPLSSSFKGIQKCT
jgi:hypothetical protein